MGSALGRIGDIGVGVCPHHRRSKNYITNIVTGSDTVLVNGEPCAVVGSIGISTCGHPTVALLGASTVNSTGSGAHREGDIGVNYGTYILLSGSSNVLGGT